MTGLILALAGAGAFYCFIFRDWDYKKKLTFKLVLAYISLSGLVLCLFAVIISIRDVYREEKDRSLSERLSGAAYEISEGDYSGLAMRMALDGDYEPEFDYLWERLEMYECCNRYLVYKEAAGKTDASLEAAEYAAKYEGMLLSLCREPEYTENLPYAEYYLRQAGLWEQ